LNKAIRDQQPTEAPLENGAPIRVNELAFDVDFYRQRYPDLANYNNDQLKDHWLNYGFAEGRQGVPLPHQPGSDVPFDVNFYRQQNPDLDNLTDDELKSHWFDYGYQEGRKGAPRQQPDSLNIDFYRWKYPDVASLDDDELISHWIESGIQEGRTGLPPQLPKSKKQALLSLIRPKHFPALRAFLEMQPTITLITDVMSSGLQSVADDFGCEVVILEDFAWYHSGEQQISDKVVDALTSALQNDSYYSDEVSDIIETEVTQSTPRLLVLLKGLDAALAHYDIPLLATSEDWFDVSRISAAWARIHEIPSLHISDSVLLLGLFTFTTYPTKDFVTVFGERGTESYYDYGFPAERVIITGNPAWDTYSRLAKHRDTIREEVFKRNNLDPALPLVTFGTNISGELGHAGVSPQVWEKTLTTFIAAIKQLFEQGFHCNVVIKEKGHSEQRREFVAYLISEAGIDPKLVAYTLDPPEEYVLASDVVVAVDSNLLIEAMLVNTPAISMQSAFYIPYSPAFAANDGIVYAENNDLAYQINHLLTDTAFRQQKLDDMKRAASYYNFGGNDGNSSQRVAKVMLGLWETDKTVAQTAIPTAPAKRRFLPSLGNVFRRPQH